MRGRVLRRGEEGDAGCGTRGGRGTRGAVARAGEGRPWALAGWALAWGPPPLVFFPFKKNMKLKQKEKMFKNKGL